MNQLKGTEKKNEEGAIETKVETVDYRSAPGKKEEQPIKENTTVVHLTKKPLDAGGALANTVLSAKDTIFGEGKHDTDKTN